MSDRKFASPGTAVAKVWQGQVELILRIAVIVSDYNNNIQIDQSQPTIVTLLSLYLCSCAASLRWLLQSLH